MRIIRKTAILERMIRRLARNRSVGFVPTMGDLHQGHLALVRRSRKRDDFTAVSIFVNPAQFNQKKDFNLYRRNQREDIKKLKREGVDLVFVPHQKEIYPEGFQTWVSVEKLSGPLCGRSRPGHFRGVATIVLKLLNLIRPTHAYFGLKDFQQWSLIRRMALDLNIPTKVVGCPTVREKDGLACSSRNRRLSASERLQAAKIFPALREVANLIKSTRKNHPGHADMQRLKKNSRNLRPVALRRYFQERAGLKKNSIDYLEWVHPVTLIPVKKIKPPVLMAAAVWIGRTRLIDNLLVGNGGAAGA